VKFLTTIEEKKMLNPGEQRAGGDDNRPRRFWEGRRTSALFRFFGFDVHYRPKVRAVGEPAEPREVVIEEIIKMDNLAQAPGDEQQVIHIAQRFQDMDVAEAMVAIGQRFRARIESLRLVDTPENRAQAQALIQEYNASIENIRVAFADILGERVTHSEIIDVLGQLHDLREFGAAQLEDIRGAIADIEGRIIDQASFELLQVQMNQVLASSQLNHEQIEQLRELFGDFENQFVSKEALNEVRRVVDNDRQRLNALERDLNQAHRQIQGIIAGNQARDERIEQLERELRNLRGDVQAFMRNSQQSHQLLTQDIAQIRASMINRQQLNQLAGQIEENRLAVNQAIGRLQTAAGDIPALRQELVDFIAQTRQENADFVAQLQQLTQGQVHQAALDELAQRIDVNHHQLQAQMADLPLIRQEIADHQGRHHDLLQQLANMQASMQQQSGLRTLVRVLLQTVERNRRNIEVLQGDVARLQPQEAQVLPTYEKDFDKNHKVLFRPEQNGIQVSIFKTSNGAVLAAKEVNDFLSHHAQRRPEALSELFQSRELAAPGFLAQHGLFAQAEQVAQWPAPRVMAV
jgi:chromosome segregation ATPase